MGMLNKAELELQLAALAKRKYCFLVSRGATALYLSYLIVKTLSKKTSSSTANRIVLPATMCHSPANVAIYAGFEIIFCDVSPDDYTLDPVRLREILESTPGVRAVVSVSIFGHAPDMSAIASLCKEFNVWLIDDAAQSIGGSCLDKPFGGWGDIGIYSFGHTKIIDVGWGGAILTDSSSVYEECVRLYNELPGPDPTIRELRSVYSETYYSVERITNKSFKLNPLFWSFPAIFRPLYVYSDNGSEEKLKEISEKLIVLSDTIERRQLYWNEYRKRIAEDPAISFPALRDGSVAWRFTFRIEREKRDEVVTTLRARHIDVSTWYPSLFNRFSPAQSLFERRSLPVAETLSKELINLWVDPEKINLEAIPPICDIINEIINEKK